jgi:hypothetical protein
MIKMRFSLAVAVLAMGMSSSGAAQNATLKAKPSAPEKAPKSTVPIAKTGNPAAASSNTSKDLQNLERQSAKASQPPQSTGKKTPGTTPAPKLAQDKDKPNPPINFAGTGRKNTKPATTGMTSQSPNPLAGRLKQKSTHP